MKKDINAHIGRKLKQRRTIMGMSQEVAAKAVGVTFQQVQKYENGSNAMNAQRLYEFSLLLKVPVAYFFEGFNEVQSSAASNQTGFAETPALAFDYEWMVQEKNSSDREDLEIMKSFKRIEEPTVRKRISDLLRAIADNKTLVD